MCYGTAIPETSLVVAHQITYTNIRSPTLGLKTGTNAWGAYLTYESGPSYQVLPPSLSPYLLRGPSCLAYPAYDPKLLQPRDWAVLPDLIQPFWFPSFFWASWAVQLVPLFRLSLPPPHMSKDHWCTLDSSRCPCLQLCPPLFFYPQ